MQSAGIPQDVYLNWHQFESFDRIRLADLDHYFSDIRYPDADDLDIVDDSATWALSIGHEGYVRVLRQM